MFGSTYRPEQAFSGCVAERIFCILSLITELDDWRLGKGRAVRDGGSAVAAFDPDDRVRTAYHR